ncbi:MAG TPA: GNAT family N-acetyltransferase [Pyrinomonadaceae bacterium]|nr:GNAT family N-acetyltransferase [Pyrinomonadaceae bacterium]
MRITRYSSAGHDEWDKFVDQSKNGVFLFRRDYLEYHADRFPDHSLMFYDGDELLALMPATLSSGVLSSHAGLTFGGMVSNNNMKVGPMLEVFAELVEYVTGQGISRLIYKSVPHIYHRLPAEEDLYALFVNRARLVRRDVSSTVDMKQRLEFSKGRRYALKQAQKHGVNVARSFDFKTFMSIEEQLLVTKYDAKPVHSTAEIEMLAARFPDNIKLFAAHDEETMVAGVIIYESAQVAHTQYVGATETGKKIGALDLIIRYLLDDYYREKKYFDFGTSIEPGGLLNAGLIENKQGFGGRAVVYDFYELDFH